ncbi:MAG: glutamate 5-kinase [SAR116 cluster bacterium]|nr:glutamate 5-kinase [SAR116 cluster bacterium]
MQLNKLKYIIESSKRIVLKVGSSLLIDEKTGEINLVWLDSFAKDLLFFLKQKKNILVVSSGSIALGRKQLNLKENLSLDEKQAAAAVGQINLSHAWKEILKSLNINSAQILLAPDDTETRRKHLNARATLDKLLQLDVVPVINENDTVSTQEIKYGDNDRLAARVSQMCSADLLILFSDIDGLYSADPTKNKNKKFIDIVDNITDEIENMAGPSNTSFSSGGMITKIEAARIATNAGCHVIISNGKLNNPLAKLYSEKGKGTLFTANRKPKNSRKLWISGALQVKGKIYIDQGAENAITRGNSILPAGIVKTEGKYNKGDLISILNIEGKILGKGLSHYSNIEVNLVKGLQSDKIETILGYRGKDEIIHKDDFVLENEMI